MKKNLFFLLIFSTAFSLSAADTGVENEVSRSVISGVEAIARKMIGVSFTPMTDYSQGSFTFSSAAGVTFIEELSADPLIEGQGLHGLTMGGGAGYGVTDRLLVYSIVDGLMINGLCEAEFLGAEAPSSKMDVSFFMANLFAGTGYKVINKPQFFLPLFVGLHGSLYSYNFGLDPVSPLPDTTINGSVTGGGFTPGLSGGLAAKYIRDRFSLEAYYIYMFDFKGIEGEADYSLESLLSFSDSQSYQTASFYGGTYGFSLKINPARKWSFSLNLADLIPLPDSNEDVDMMTLSLSVGYRG